MIIELEKYYLRIEKIVKLHFVNRWYYLAPIPILRKLDSSLLSQTKIFNWEKFELGQIDYDEVDFYKLVFSACEGKETITLLTDTGILNNVAFEFVASDFFIFTAWYIEKFNSEFIQPEDYIILLDNNVFIAISNGFIFRYPSLKNE